MAAEAQRPPGDAQRLLELVRGMPADAFVDLFRTGLPPAELLRVIGALPPDRRDALLDRAGEALPPDRPGRPGRGAGVSLATAIRQARTRARLSQVELAAALGIRQSSVSQWERGATEPATQTLLDLLRVLPGLADALHAVAAPGTAAGQTGVP
jgi:DNA-binding transcriptional regulator YiaG